MQRLITLLMTVLFGIGLGFGQTGGDKTKTELNPQPLPPGRHPQTAVANAHKGSKKAHKGGKKSKKGAGDAGTTPPPK